ncbi:MAG: hypothetical protein IIW10_04230 [Spirochaetaceae bacterium]|nr:hypothetical protein [Spirochaetaceae bacterium]
MSDVKKKLSVKQKILVAVFGFLSLILFVLGGLIAFLRLSVIDYYIASERTFRIPDIGKGIVPQGFDYDKKNDYFLVSGYMKDNSPARLYLVDRKTGENLKYVTLLDNDGNDYTGHFGGVALYNNLIYVAHETSILVYSYKDILSAKSQDKIKQRGEINTKISDTDYVTNSFVSVYGNKLIAGEFCDEPKYITLDTHKITTPSGDKNEAIMLEYDLHPQYPLGTNGIPRRAYSITGKVQGTCFTNDKIYLSTSYGMSFSHIKEYDINSLTKTGDGVFLGLPVPIYSLDSSSMTYDYEIAPMSEEIIMLDDELYTMCESASTKYIFGNLTASQWCYKTDLEKMRKQ